MLLSIVIPVYNVAEYLRGCVESVLANDCTDCEVILVDDGATDGICPQLCDELAQAHPELVQVIHQENQGLGGARNTGLAAAKGEYVFFVDSDDTITPDALTVLKKAISGSHADVYSFQLYTHDGTGPQKRVEVSPVYQGVFSLGEHPEFLLSLPAAWARIWKVELFDLANVRYPSRVWYEDIRTSTKLFAAASSIVTLPDALYGYLQRPGSIMRSGNLKRNVEIIWAFEDILAWFQENDLRQAYEDELCRLAIDHLYLAASVRVACLDPGSPILGELAEFMETHFPHFRENPYIPRLSRLHRLLLKLLDGHHYKLIRLLFKLKGTA